MKDQKWLIINQAQIKGFKCIERVAWDFFMDANRKNYNGCRILLRGLVRELADFRFVNFKTKELAANYVRDKAGKPRYLKTALLTPVFVGNYTNLKVELPKDVSDKIHKAKLSPDFQSFTYNSGADVQGIYNETSGGALSKAILIKSWDF